MDIKIPYETLRQIIGFAKLRNQLERQVYPDAVDVKTGLAIMSSAEGQTVEEVSNRLWDLLVSLPYDELLEVESLMLYGRGDFASYEDGLSFMRRDYPDESGRSMAAEYVTSKDPLDEYLESALKKLGII